MYLGFSLCSLQGLGPASTATRLAITPCLLLLLAAAESAPGSCGFESCLATIRPRKPVQGRSLFQAPSLQVLEGLQRQSHAGALRLNAVVTEDDEDDFNRIPRPALKHKQQAKYSKTKSVSFFQVASAEAGNVKVPEEDGPTSSDGPAQPLLVATSESTPNPTPHLVTVSLEMNATAVHKNATATAPDGSSASFSDAVNESIVSKDVEQKSAVVNGSNVSSGLQKSASELEVSKRLTLQQSHEQILQNVSAQPYQSGQQYSMQEEWMAAEQLHIRTPPTGWGGSGIVLLLLGTALSGSFLFCGFRAAFTAWQNRLRSNATRQRVEELRISPGSEIQSMFAVHRGLNSDDVANEKCGDRLPKQPMSPGLLIRLKGYVRTGPMDGKVLSAPLSARPCLMYSASVSQRQDGSVHRPPLAFYSAGVDFAIQLADAPHITIKVHSQDVTLFDMVEGRFASEALFAEAPDNWRGYTLAHLVSGSPSHGAGLDGVLEFKECALVEGGLVTAIGEVARDRHGDLHLHPWRPPLASACGALSKAPSTTSWERSGLGLRSAAQPDPAVGRILVSDDALLLDSAPLMPYALTGANVS